jgi:hypothetical protein
MEILDGFAAGQPPTESHSLDGCLTDIQPHALGYHGVKATPLLGRLDGRILQG